MGVSAVTGEAFVNNRKRKLIPSYEIALQGSWKGRAAVLVSCWSCAMLAESRDGTFAVNPGALASMYQQQNAPPQTQQGSSAHQIQ